MLGLMCHEEDYIGKNYIEVKTILTESPKYKDAQRWMDGDDTLDYDDCPYSWENENDDAFYISCVYDDYYELIKIEEKEIQY